MPTKVTYSYARQNLAGVLKDAEDTQEPVIITRRGHEEMAIIPAAELASLRESVHLLRSPANAQRLLRALKRALEDTVEPQSPEELREELDLR